VPHIPLNRRIDTDTDRGGRFLSRSKVAGFWLNKAVALGLQNPSLVSSQTGRIEKVLFAFPQFGLQDPDSVAAYRSVIGALRPGTEFVVACVQASKAQVRTWFTAAGHAEENVTVALMPDYARFTDWAEDAYVSLTDLADGAHYLMEPWEFRRAGDALIADEVEQYSDSRASQAPLIFQGGNVLVGDAHWFLGRDYLADSIDLLVRRGGPIALPPGSDPEEQARSLFKKHVEATRELVVVGPRKPLALREYVGTQEGGAYFLDVAAEGAGSYQPIFHIDMFISLAGRAVDGRQRVLVGDPRLGEKILGEEMPFALSSVYDQIAADLASLGFDVIRNPIVHWPSDGGTRTVRELKQMAEGEGGAVLAPAIKELTAAGAMDASAVHVRSWHHVTWNNCLVEASAAVGNNVYLPTFGYGKYAALSAIDTHMKALWEHLGFTCHMLGNFNSFAERMGVVHCIKKYMRRGA
jgi:hypothetical protein